MLEDDPLLWGFVGHFQMPKMPVARRERYPKQTKCNNSNELIDRRPSKNEAIYQLGMLGLHEGI